jgi:hypothetical protein
MTRLFPVLSVLCLVGCLTSDLDQQQGTQNAADVQAGSYRVSPDFQAYLCASPGVGCMARATTSYWDVASTRLSWRTYLGDTLWCRGSGDLVRRADRLIVRAVGDTCLVVDDDDVLRPDSLYIRDWDSVRYFVSEVTATRFRAKQTTNSPWMVMTR